MGITNLHQFLKPSSRSNVRIDEFAGQTLGVDALCWLHRGAIASAYELYTETDCDKYLKFFVNMVAMFHASRVSLVVVFDGCSLPAKKSEEEQRRSKREAAKEQLAKVKNLTKKKVFSDHQLRGLLYQCISMSSDMITACMSVLRLLGVPFVVAPYEADAQLGFMCATGAIQGVVSEDSDILCYGAKKLIGKVDQHTQTCQVVDLAWAFTKPHAALTYSVTSEAGDEGEDGESDSDDVEESVEAEGDAGGKAEGQADGPGVSCTSTSQVFSSDLGELLKLVKWSPKMFLDMCVMAGSDYHGCHIKGLGIKTAFKLVNRYKSGEKAIRTFLEDARKKNKSPTEMTVDEAISAFRCAIAAFEAHRVFDKNGTCKHFYQARKDHEEGRMRNAKSQNQDDQSSLGHCDQSLGRGESQSTEAQPQYSEHMTAERLAEIVGLHVDSKVYTGELIARTLQPREFLTQLPPGLSGVKVSHGIAPQKNIPAIHTSHPASVAFDINNNCNPVNSALPGDKIKESILSGLGIKQSKQQKAPNTTVAHNVDVPKNASINHTVNVSHNMSSVNVGSQETNAGSQMDAYSPSQACDDQPSIDWNALPTIGPIKRLGNKENIQDLENIDLESEKCGSEDEKLVGAGTTTTSTGKTTKTTPQINNPFRAQSKPASIVLPEANGRQMSRACLDSLNNYRFPFKRVRNSEGGANGLPSNFGASADNANLKPLKLARSSVNGARPTVAEVMAVTRDVANELSHSDKSNSKPAWRGARFA